MRMGNSGAYSARYAADGHRDSRGDKMVEKEQMYMVEKTGVRIFKNAYTDKINEAMHKLHALRAEEARINASISDMVAEISMDFKRFIESVKIGDKVDVLPSIDDSIRSGVVVETGRELMESYFILSTEHGIIKVSGKVNSSVVWATAKKGCE